MIHVSNMGKEGKVITTTLFLAAIISAGVVGVAFYFSSSSIHSLLTENHKLHKAIRNLTDERQIGYATVISQNKNELGQLESLVKFVQTAPSNPDEVISEQLFTVRGDIVHFDALIVKFTDAYVQDGKGRALYLWRRIYGEQTPPEQGQPIEVPGDSPERYRAITESLQLKNRPVFWEAIWDLANNPQALGEYGVTAIYGNAIYAKMKPGQIYVFKISATGQIYPDLLSYR